VIRPSEGFPEQNPVGRAGEYLDLARGVVTASGATRRDNRTDEAKR
jgi:hypothetical protein